MREVDVEKTSTDSRGVDGVSFACCAFATPEKKPYGKWIELFNGKDQTGWTHIGREASSSKTERS